VSTTGPSQPEFDVRSYVRTLRRHAILIVGAAAVVMASALFFTSMNNNLYRATSSVLLKPTLTDTLVDPNGGKTITDVATASRLITSTPVRALVVAALGPDLPPVAVTRSGNTSVIELSVVSTDPALAAAVADAYATNFIEFRRTQDVGDLTAVSDKYREQIAGLQEQLDFIAANEAVIQPPATVDPGVAGRKSELRSQINSLQGQINQLQLDASLRSGGAQLVSTAAVPTAPIGARRLQSLGLFGAVGLLYGLVLAFGVDYFDDLVRTKERLEQVTSGLPMLGLIPVLPDWKDHRAARLVTLEAPRSQIAEAYRSLRTSVQFLSVREPVSIVHVTSAEPGEGKSTTVANLGVSLADAGLRVIVIDCDLRRPRLHKFFDLDNDVGFCSVVREEASLLDAMHWLDTERYGKLAILTSGPVPTNPSELIGAPRVKALLDQMTELADVILLDSAPVVPVTDTLVLSAYADATILVARVGVTSGRSLVRATELLQRVGARVVGTVLNAAEPNSGYYGSYRYRYRRGYYYGGYNSNAPYGESPGVVPEVDPGSS
jgi:succinoglycan biosynthesis transport protein ExoP